MEQKEKVGKIAHDLLTKADDKHTVIDQMREQLSDYDRNLYISIEEGKKKWSSDFYVVVLTKKERLMENVIRNYFIGRLTCPTPEYDQVVYKYNHKSEIIDFLWVVPAKDVCRYMLQNALNLPESERDLLNFVIKFDNGELLKQSKKLNGEAGDSILIVKE
jgi:hypothetical protein